MKGSIYNNSANSCEQDTTYQYSQQKKNTSKINQLAITQSSLKLSRKNLIPTEEYVSKADAVYKKVVKMMAMSNEGEGSSPEKKIVNNLVKNGQVNNQVHHVVSNDSYEFQSEHMQENGISPINNRFEKHYFTGFPDQLETSTKPVKQDISLSSSSCLSESHMLAESCMVYQPHSSKNSARNSFPEADVLLKMLDDQIGKKDCSAVIRSNISINNEIQHANQSVNDFITTVLKQEYTQVSECDTSYRRNQIRIARSNELVESPRGPKPPLPSIFKSIKNPINSDQTAIKIVQEYSQDQLIESNNLDQQHQQPKQKKLSLHALPSISIQPRKKNLGYFSFVITMLQPFISNKDTYTMPISPRMPISTSSHFSTSPHMQNSLNSQCFCENLKMMQFENLKMMQDTFKQPKKSNRSLKKVQIENNFRRKSQERLSRIEQTLFELKSSKQQESQIRLMSPQLNLNSPFNQLKEQIEQQQGINYPRNIEQVEKMQSFSSEHSKSVESKQLKQSNKITKIDNQQKPMQQDSAAQSKFTQSQLILPLETNSYMNEYVDKSYLIQDGIDLEANQSENIIEQIKLVTDNYNISQLNQKSPKSISFSSQCELSNNFDMGLVMKQQKDKDEINLYKSNYETVTYQTIGNNYYRAESTKDSKNNSSNQTSIYTKNIALQRTDSTKSIDNNLKSRQETMKQIVAPNTHFSKMNTEQINSTQRNKAISQMEFVSPNQKNKPNTKQEQINSIQRNKAISHLELFSPNQKNKPNPKQEQINSIIRQQALTKVESTNFIDKNKYIAKQKKNLIDPYIEFKRALNKNLIKDPQSVTQSQVSYRDTHLSSNQSQTENVLGLYQKTINQVQVKLLEMQLCFKK